jgi:hypothetical protein
MLFAPVVSVNPIAGLVKQIIHTVLSVPEMRWDNQMASGLYDRQAGMRLAFVLTARRPTTWARQEGAGNRLASGAGAYGPAMGGAEQLEQ